VPRGLVTSQVEAPDVLEDERRVTGLGLGAYVVKCSCLSSSQRLTLQEDEDKADRASGSEERQLSARSSVRRRVSSQIVEGRSVKLASDKASVVRLEKRLIEEGMIARGLLERLRIWREAGRLSRPLMI